MARTRAHAASESDLDQPDGVLCHRAAAGDREAFEVLYQRHAAAAQRVAMAVTGDPHDAADATSEAFAKLLQALSNGRLDPTAPFRPYLLATTRNAAVDALRRTGRVEPTEDVGSEHAAATAEPQQRLIDGADSALVAEAFRSLPDRWRSVLWLTEVEDIPARDVAGLLGISPNGVAQLAVRARTGLRQRFLQAHLGAGAVLPGCQGTVSLLGAYVAGGLAPRDLALVDQHLAGCPGCQAREAELRDLGPTLRRAILPVGGGLTGIRHALLRLLHGGVVSARRAVSGPLDAARIAVPLAAASAGILVAGVGGAGVMGARAAAPRHAHAVAAVEMSVATTAAPSASVPAPMAIVPANRLSTAPTAAAAPSGGAGGRNAAAAPSPSTVATPGAVKSTQAPAPSSNPVPGAIGGVTGLPIPATLPGTTPTVPGVPVDPGTVVSPVCDALAPVNATCPVLGPLPVTVLPLDPTIVPAPISASYIAPFAGGTLRAPTINLAQVFGLVFDQVDAFDAVAASSTAAGVSAPIIDGPVIGRFS